MRVLVFGAGASKSAGYPTADNLMPEVERYSLAQPLKIPGPRANWEQWSEIRDGSLQSMEFLLKNPNPEVILSTLDLFVAAYAAVEHSDSWSFRGYGTRSLTPDQERLAAEGAKRVMSARARAHTPANARACVVECLHDYFQHQHALDADPRSVSRYTYLRELFCQLRDGDLIITFNWDALAERVLAELDLWTPIDGYGLNFKHLRFRDGPLAGPGKSAVKVLKLHGSLGWYQAPHRSDGTGIKLDGHIFLKHMGIACDNEPFTHGNPLPDTNYADFMGGYWCRPLIVYPTFLKAVGGRQFAALWHQAAMALSHADAIDIYGYSLPASDGAGRVLLNGLRPRLGRRGPKVHVHDPSPEARRNWRYFLGKRAHVTADRLG